MQFGLQFETTDGEAPDAGTEKAPAAVPAASALPAPAKDQANEAGEEPAKPSEGAEVVRLDRFRKK